MKKIISAIVSLSTGALVVSKINSKSYIHTEQYRYVITETSGPTSLDPLDGDQTQNLPVQRMIYATPIEVDAKGSLQSLVLDNFIFDPTTKTMTWTVKTGLKFSDGSDITPDDIAFAVKRMAFSRPKFPVIDEIEGVQEWSKASNALESYPSGIKIVGNKIEIKFNHFVEHPIFRFCLEIFSIIPKSCVDTKTNKISCEKIPFSGHYKIVNKSESQISFVMKDDSTLGNSAPKNIMFEYKLPSEVFEEEYIPSGTVIIQGNEIKFSLDQLKKIKQHLQTSYLPSARIALNMLNPNIVPFKEKTCRLVFAEAYRKAFASLATVDFKIESSLFTDVLPGYMTPSELSKQELIKISESEKNKCLQQMKLTPPRWAFVKEDADSIYSLVAERAFEILGIPKPNPKVFNTRKEETDAFIKGDISILGASTGFWAMDPVGDIQMLLTPNMHKILQFVSNDEKIQLLIKNLKGIDERNSKTSFNVLNQYVHDKGLFNVFAHVRRFYSSSSLDNISELPISITSPAPWQVFRMK